LPELKGKAGIFIDPDEITLTFDDDGNLIPRDLGS
jgi:hypothetical protein